MKRKLLSILLLISTAGFAQITVSEEYTATELAADILFNTPDITVSNVLATTGTDFGSVNGLGYFNQNGSSFPFPQGIVLSTGNLLAVPGPNLTGSNGGSDDWPGDTYLDGLLATQTPETSINATSLEFDFIASTTHLSIDYIFASEEYLYLNQCLYNDICAIVLTHTATGTQINIATVPGTDTPVSVWSIRDPFGDCEPSHPEYFGMDYSIFPAGATAPINFNGTTIPLTAEAIIIPGELYHIKFIVADMQDRVSDSALFIKSLVIPPAPLNIGTPYNLSRCDNSNNGLESFNLTLNSQTILNGLDPLEHTISYHESLYGAENNEDIILEPSSYLNINPYEQTIYVRVSSNSDPLITAVTEFQINVMITPVPGNVETLMVLDNDTDGSYMVNLTSVDEQILDGKPSWEYTITYYLSPENAFEDVNAIEDPISFYTSSTTIYFRLQKNQELCHSTGSFEIIILEATPPPTGNSIQYFTAGETIVDLEVDGENIQWYASVAGDTPLPLETLLVNGTTYYASQTINGIESEERLPVTAVETLSVKDNAFIQFSYYPNPVTDELYIRNGTGISRIEVYNMRGQLVKSMDINSSEAIIPFTKFQQGLYILLIKSGSSVKSVEIIKK